METTEVLTPEQIVEQLRALRAHVPDFGQVAANERRPLSRISAVSPAFVAAAGNAVMEIPRVAEILGRTAQDQQQDAVDARRWETVETEIEAFKQGVSASNLVRRHRMGLTALQTFNICRQLIRQKANAALLEVHVQKMTELKKFAAVKRKPRPAQPEPQPSPGIPV